jgi:adenine/guanine phosphoribosyltransferase-like PRPP-binding protein
MAITRTASYLSTVFSDTDGLIERIVHRLAQECHEEFDTICGVGCSGSLILLQLAKRLGKHAAIIRKQREGCHSEYAVEGTVGTRWILIDDLVASGNTVNTARKTMMKHAQYIRDVAGLYSKADQDAYGFRPVFVGCFCYFEGGWHARDYNRFENLDDDTMPQPKADPAADGEPSKPFKRPLTRKIIETYIDEAISADEQVARINARAAAIVSGMKKVCETRRLPAPDDTQCIEVNIPLRYWNVERQFLPRLNQDADKTDTSGPEAVQAGYEPRETDSAAGRPAGSEDGTNLFGVGAGQEI